jgi:hypothetical protein
VLFATIQAGGVTPSGSLIPGGDRWSVGGSESEERPPSPGYHNWGPSRVHALSWFFDCRILCCRILIGSWLSFGFGVRFEFPSMC